MTAVYRLTDEAASRRLMTVAQIRDGDPSVVEVAFFESARFFTLRRDHPELERCLALLRGSMESAEPLRVSLEPHEGGEIVDVGRS
jgi:hypothetical protein